MLGARVWSSSAPGYGRRFMLLLLQGRGPQVAPEQVSRYRPEGAGHEVAVGSNEQYAAHILNRVFPMSSDCAVVR
jgi:hypothetical protein